MLQECNNDDRSITPPRSYSPLIVLSPKHSILPSISLLSLVRLLCIFFFLSLLRPPLLLLLPPLLHSLVVLFCTQSLLDHCITNRFLVIFFWSFDYCLLRSEVVKNTSEVVYNTSAKIHHGEPSTLFFFFCCHHLKTSQVQVTQTGCNFEHTSSC